eukprot:NODE_631_length_1313_cov_251.650927_g592_i0.p1 GENE.NODE_631_length_1313_cov_251.650927_g592_i0~~NODE_631_length_1313_cov_251.650927_g592_i0.p1  ORF type:complete len:359 (+),score=60.16 NODE_631_length_1313_cov_251.650927_g592_i0:102-1178(+)
MWSPRRSALGARAKVPEVSTPRGNETQSKSPSTPPSQKTPSSFITSSPRTPVKTTPKTKKPNKERSSAPMQRTPSKIMFSPPYNANKTGSRHTPPPSEPHVAPTQLSPSQLRLQQNLALHGHKEQEFDEYDEDEFDPWRFIALLPPLARTRSNRPTVLPPKSCSRMTLVLDLDETLVHCSTDPSEIRNPCFLFDVHFNSQIYKVSAKKRPGFEEFLEHVSSKFETVVFTASQRVYADKLLDILDKDRKLVHHRVFRDDCTNAEGNYLKDLTVLGRDLRRTVIVDNSPQAFSYQLDNGMPILSWFDSEDDRELYKIIPFLEQLAHADDVRPLLRDRFKLHHKVASKATDMGCSAQVLHY